MYTLILSFSNRGGFIHSIPGFATFELANSAGREWQKEQEFEARPSYVVAMMG
jgi:hypothetical protein